MQMKKVIWITIAAAGSIAVLFSLNCIVSFFQPTEYQIKEVNFSEYSDIGTGYALLNELEYDESDIELYTRVCD